MNLVTTSRIAAVLMLAAAAVHRVATAREVPGADDYFARVRQAVADAPKRAGRWIGRDVALPTQATTLLLPNATLSRQYTDLETGRVVGLALVHCRDAHDMAGHFPTRCYPAAGWTLLAATPDSWSVGGRTLRGTTYRFARQTTTVAGGQAEEIVVSGVLLRPNNRVPADMNEMAASVRGDASQSVGAAQVQVYTSAGVPDDARHSAVAELLTANGPAIEAVLAPIGG